MFIINPYIFGSGYTIENAILFDAGSSDYLSRTPSSAGNRKTWTFSAWLKRGQINSLSGVHLFGADRGSGYGDRITFGNGDTDDRFNVTFNDAGSGRLQTDAFFRDPTAWTHFLIAVDTTQTTAANRVKIYVNGTLIDDLNTSSYPAEDYETAVNNTAAQMIGARGGSASQFMDGYMAEVILLDGAAVSDASSFGELDDNGVWIPKNPSDLSSTVGQVLIPQDTGSTIGTMDTRTSAAFDGNNNQDENNAASHSSAATSVTIGKDFGSGNAKTVNQVKVWGYNGGGFTSNASENCTITVKGSNSGIGSSEVTLHSSGTISDTTNSNKQTFSFSNSTAYRYVWIELTQSPSNYFFVAELEFYEEGTVGFGTNGFHLKFDDANNPGKSSTPSTAASVSYVSTGTNDTSANSYTFSSQNIGTAASDRWVVVAATAYNTGRSVQSLTIGGTNATKIVEAKTPSGNSATVAIYALQVSSGTSADIVIDYGGAGQISCGIMVWNVNSSSGSWNTATDTDASDPLTASVSVNDGGVVIAASAYAGGTAPTNVVWAELTENNDAVVESSPSPFWQSGASKAYSSGQTVNISANHDNSQSQLNLAAAVFNADGDNSFANNSITSTQQVTDTPTDDAGNNIGNYATYNDRAVRIQNILSSAENNIDLTNGNLTATRSGSGTYQQNIPLTIALPPEGKWHVEFDVTSIGSHSGYYNQFGICPAADWANNSTSVQDIGWTWRVGKSASKTMLGGTDETTSLTTISSAFRATLDIDLSTIGSSTIKGTLNGSVDVTDTGLALSDEPHVIWTWFDNDTSGFATTITLNTGQTSFTDTPVSGHVGINTANLPAPTVTKPDDFFKTVLYTGNGSTLAVTGAGFQPDFLWMKSRSVATNWNIYDAVRTANSMIRSNSANGEQTGSDNELSSFGADGFTVTHAGGVVEELNRDDETYVAYCLKANGTGSSNTDGNVTGGSTVSVASHNGFAIVTYGDCGGAAKTIGHGMGQAPDMIMVKNLTGTARTWRVYHKDLTSDYVLYLNTVEPQASEPLSFGTIGTSTFGVDGGPGTSANGETHVAYCFARTPGLIAVGSFEGANSADGTNIVLDDGGSGFKPAFFMFKNMDSNGDWYTFDSTRNTYNPVNSLLALNQSHNESTMASNSSNGTVDFTANGVKFLSTNGSDFQGAKTFIYLAFAETPFGGDTVSQARAR
jgi:hypothetical protein